MDAILMQQKQIIINNCFIENAEDISDFVTEVEMMMHSYCCLENVRHSCLAVCMVQDPSSCCTHQRISASLGNRAFSSYPFLLLLSM